MPAFEIVTAQTIRGFAVPAFRGDLHENERLEILELVIGIVHILVKNLSELMVRDASEEHLYGLRREIEKAVAGEDQDCGEPDIVGPFDAAADGRRRRSTTALRKPTILPDCDVSAPINRR